MTKNKNRCVITGLGMMSAIGNSVDECFSNAINSISGIKEIKSVDTTNCYANLAAEINSNIDVDLDGVDRVTKLCIKATKEALEDAKLEKFNNSQRVSVIIGSCVGGVVSIEHYYKNNNKDVNDIKQMPISAIASQVASYVEAGGVVTNIANACAAGTISIAYACDLIRQGKADIVIAGGADAFASVPYSGFLALHALDKDPCSPFNHCTGITLGEGSGIVIVESYEHAINRDSKIYCEVLSSGISSDAHHITAPRPDGEGQMNAIKWAISSSGLTENDIDYINAHGTGTAKNDNAEFLSLHTIFDNTNDHLSVSSTKAMVGHCLGAAGAIEAVFSIKALTENIVPATIGYSDEDLQRLKEKAGNIDFVPNRAIKKQLTNVMSNSFAFGGNNASIIFSKESGNVQEGSKKDIFITGFGSVTPLGNTVEEYIRIVNENKRITSNNVRSMVTSTDYQELGIPMSFYRKLDTISQLECVSGMYALKNANIKVTDDNATKIGIVVGTSEGALGMGCVFEENINKKGNSQGSAFSFPNTVYNAAGGYLSICSGIKGYNVTSTNGAQSGLSSLCYAKNIMNEGKAELVLASGVDENIDVTTELYTNLGLITDEYVKPFSGSNGFNLSDGAVTIVCETTESINQRNQKKYCKIVGCGMANEPVPFGTIKGSSNGLDKAINEALNEANMTASDVDAVVCFANGCQTVDEEEIKSLKRVFTNIEQIPLITPKERFGEGRAMSAAMSAMHGALMLSGDIKEDDMAYFYNNDSYVKTTVYSKDLSKILVTAFGSGGTYTAVILSRE